MVKSGVDSTTSVCRKVRYETYQVNPWQYQKWRLSCLSTNCFHSSASCCALGFPTASRGPALSPITASWRASPAIFDVWASTPTFLVSSPYNLISWLWSQNSALLTPLNSSYSLISPTQGWEFSRQWLVPHTSASTSFSQSSHTQLSATREEGSLPDTADTWWYFCHPSDKKKQADVTIFAWKVFPILCYYTMRTASPLADLYENHLRDLRLDRDTSSTQSSGLLP